MNAPEMCQICGTSGPVLTMMDSQRTRAGVLLAVWQYLCGHTYGVYAPEERRARGTVTDLQTRKAGALGGGGGRSRRRRNAAVMDRPTTTELYHALSSSHLVTCDPAQPTQPLADRECPCGCGSFTPRRRNHRYRDRNCLLRLAQQRHREKTG